MEPEPQSAGRERRTSTLRPPRTGVRVMLRVGALGADVRWCAGDAATGYRAGLRLRRRLPYRDLMDLARN